MSGIEERNDVIQPLSEIFIGFLKILIDFFLLLLCLHF